MPDLPMGTVTMLFTDIEGSTHLLERMGERYTGALAEYRSLLRAAFHAYGGHEVDTQGDSFVRPEVACVEWSESSQPSVQGCLQSLSASLVTVRWKARGNVQGSF